MFRRCFCSGLLLLVFAFAAAAQDIPFKVEKGYLLVDGKVKGDLPFEAAVSTGSEYSFYNGASLKKLRLFEKSSSEMPGTVLHDTALTLVSATLGIGEQKPVEMIMLPRRDAFDAMSRALGRKIDFILGTDYFDGRIVQFDFRSHVIRFLDNPPVDVYKTGTTSSPNGAIRVVSKMTGTVDSLFGNMLTLPVADDVTVDGTKAPSLLNTGVIMPVTAQPTVAKNAAAAKGSSQTPTVTVALGAYQMTGVPVRVDDVKEDYDKTYTAILGLGLLQNFTITFDWKNKWIIFDK